MLWAQVLLTAQLVEFSRLLVLLVSKEGLETCISLEA